MTALLVVAIGGAIGALLRYFMTLTIVRTGQPAYRATFLVNIVGSALLGFLGGLHPDPTVALLVGTGFTGGLTTFSTFAVEVVRMKQFALRMGYLISSLLTGWVVAWLGWAIAQWITQ